MWTDHTEYEEYQKLQLSMVVRYQHNNTLGKILSTYRFRNNPKKYQDIFFFSISYTPSMKSVSYRPKICFNSSTPSLIFYVFCKKFIFSLSVFFVLEISSLILK